MEDEDGGGGGHEDEGGGFDPKSDAEDGSKTGRFFERWANGELPEEDEREEVGGSEGAFHESLAIVKEKIGREDVEEGDDENSPAGDKPAG